MTTRPRIALDKVYAGPFDLPDLCRPGESWPKARARLRAAFADHLYGPIPAPPLAMECARVPLPHTGADRLILTLTLPNGTFTVDAALWLPQGDGPWPVICGLDFIGPAGILPGRDYPLDAHTVVSPRPEQGAYDGRLRDELRGIAAPSWPVGMLTQSGYAVIVSCYGSWAPDDPDAFSSYGLRPMTGADTGAISLWAYAYSRLIDAAETIPQIDKSNVTLVGHSRLGKAALWAAANDPRVTATFANNSGAAGAAPAAHPVGETLDQLQTRFPHWLRPNADPSAAEIDQHALIALTAPRAVYLADAEEDNWADPIGSYVALTAAAQIWSVPTPKSWPSPETIWYPGTQIKNGPLGWHLRAGGHGLLPHDWHRFLDFLQGLP